MTADHTPKSRTHFSGSQGLLSRLQAAVAVPTSLAAVTLKPGVTRTLLPCRLVFITLRAHTRLFPGLSPPSRQKAERLTSLRDSLSVPCYTAGAGNPPSTTESGSGLDGLLPSVLQPNIQGWPGVRRPAPLEGWWSVPRGQVPGAPTAAHPAEKPALSSSDQSRWGVSSHFPCTLNSSLTKVDVYIFQDGWLCGKMAPQKSKEKCHVIR